MPGDCLGILGGGQLGRMIALAAARLGLDVAILDPEPDCPASRVAAHHICTPFDDPRGLAELARLSHRITLEFENVPRAALDQLKAMGADVWPDAQALSVTQDRVLEKAFLNRIGISTTGFVAIDSPDDLSGALASLGAPALLKTRREGYDGKGQVWIHSEQDCSASFARLGAVPSILEARANFVRELSIMVARNTGGQIATYDLAENTHENGILRRSVAPAHATTALRDAAHGLACEVMQALSYVGVMGIELFEMSDGRLLVNELAPRVHNSGHWTQSGAATCQFEQHVRAVCGWPLGNTMAIARIEMTNLIGDEASDWDKILSQPDLQLHLYGKREARPGRKMGHVNRWLGPAQDA